MTARPGPVLWPRRAGQDKDSGADNGADAEGDRD